MSKQIDLVEAATSFTDSDVTQSHQSYRDYQENTRAMLCAISLVLSDDAAHIAAWMRSRTGPDGRRVKWLSRIWFASRAFAHGNQAAEAFLEAAKAVVRMSAVHQEYLLAEQQARKAGGDDAKRKGRYETKDGA
ncbi:hypothetical protein Ppa06_64630 [Planomonospora parontospora subsp. parontospora]|uniref:Uncharacterized protein n=2 Tax=Planomonospora parontospora TaxID=58119 RepID=A0AA37BN39_9ACTN|nr:hypothetical protein [Planomonospora parontospora]GGK94269.1 hypothetical protein GCM10010126_62090 [Planomonospora parontospora]GII12665.1 hypothetical protein Ppa06_64630 [Planomonospora parontospora subsp. parontospora]